MTTTLEQLFGSRLAVTLADVVAAADRTAARTRLDDAGYARYSLIDRGSYHVALSPAEPALLHRVLAATAKATGRALVVTDARVLRLSPGDYLLAHHDRDHQDELVEAILDLSAATVPAAEVHYRRRGQGFFHVPSAPGSLSVVERSPEVSCYHSYVSKRHVGSSVVRLVVRMHQQP